MPPASGSLRLMALPSLSALSLSKLHPEQANVPHEKQPTNPPYSNAPLIHDWRPIFEWLPSRVETKPARKYGTRSFICIDCNYCDATINVPADRYPALAAKAIYCHVQKCDSAPDVTPPLHRRKNQNVPSPNRARNQLYFGKTANCALVMKKHDLGSLIKYNHRGERDNHGPGHPIHAGVGPRKITLSGAPITMPSTVIGP